jgi:hypothetical protein
MAATWLKPLHINKGKTLFQTILERTGYAENPEKTQGGTLVSGYECIPHTAAEEFAVSKREYEHITGRNNGKKNVLLRTITISTCLSEILRLMMKSKPTAIFMFYRLEKRAFSSKNICVKFQSFDESKNDKKAKITHMILCSVYADLQSFREQI